MLFRRSKVGMRMMSDNKVTSDYTKEHLTSQVKQDAITSSGLIKHSSFLAYQGPWPKNKPEATEIPCPLDPTVDPVA